MSTTNAAPKRKRGDLSKCPPAKRPTKVTRDSILRDYRMWERSNGEFWNFSTVEDRAPMLAAVSVRGGALGLACRKLLNDREVVMAAVKNTGWALKYASDALQNDKEVVRCALKHRCIGVLQYASLNLRFDPEFALEAVKMDASNFEHTSFVLRDDPEFVLAAVMQYAYPLRFAAPKWTTQKEYAKFVIRANPWALVALSDDLKNDFDVVMEAVQIEGMAIRFASESLRDDAQVFEAALKQNVRAFFFGSERLQRLKRHGTEMDSEPVLPQVFGVAFDKNGDVIGSRIHAPMIKQ